MTEQVLHTAAIHRVLRTGQVPRRQTLPAYQNQQVPVPTARRAVNPDHVRDIIGQGCNGCAAGRIAAGESRFFSYTVRCLVIDQVKPTNVAAVSN